MLQIYVQLAKTILITNNNNIHNYNSTVLWQIFNQPLFIIWLLSTCGTLLWLQCAELLTI